MLFLKLKKKKERKLEKEKELNESLIKDGMIRDMRTLFEQEEDYYEPKRLSKFWNNNYIKYQGKNRNLSFDECLNKIEAYLRNIIIALQNFDTWKIRLIIAKKIISSVDTVNNALE